MKLFHLLRLHDPVVLNLLQLYFVSWKLLVLPMVTVSDMLSELLKLLRLFPSYNTKLLNSFLLNISQVLIKFTPCHQHLHPPPLSPVLQS